MADITVTAANVRPDTSKGLVQGTSGAAITAGQLCYKDPTLSTWFPGQLPLGNAVLSTYNKVKKLLPFMNCETFNISFDCFSLTSK